MIRVVMGMDEAVSSIVASLIPSMDGPQEWGPLTTIGIAIEDELIGGVVYNNFTKWSVEYHCSFIRTPKLTRRVLGVLFAYPFNQLDVERITTITAARNKRAQRINKAMGFRLEGQARRAFDGIDDAMIYGMLHEECRWLKYAELLPTDYIGEQLWAEAAVVRAGHSSPLSQTQTN